MSATVDWAHQVAENARQYRELQDRLARLTLTETSRDRTVAVTVSASGVLTDLTLTERGQPRPLAQIAAEVMDCVRRAQARIPVLLQTTMADVGTADDPAARQIVAVARSRFPPPPPQPQRRPVADQRRVDRPPPVAPAPPPRSVNPPPTGRPERVIEDDWDERPVLGDIDEGHR